MQDNLVESFNSANFSQTSTSSDSINRFLESWKGHIQDKVSEEQKVKVQEIVLKNKPTAAPGLNDWKIIAPSYVISELKSALSSGFRILLPFIIIDLIVAYLFTALSIQSLGAAALAFPLKLLAFISVDGISLISTKILSSLI